jgi:endothelin-converting enzyme/putative endopeptidase
MGLQAVQARTAQVKTATPSGVELASLDRSVDPCVDYYRFACGGWMDAHPLPADRQSFGRTNEIRDRNDVILRRILERPRASGDLRQASDYYAACTDTGAINAKGLAPLRPELDRIAVLTDIHGLPELLAHLHMMAASNPASGIGAASTFPFFQLVARNDPADASHLMALVRPQGLGLPDRDYYTKTDDRSVKLRADYRAHIARMLVLAGATPAGADSAADAVLRIETALATARLDATAQRVPGSTVHVSSVADLQALTPSFDWGRYVAARHTPPFDRLNISQPKVVVEVEHQLASTPIDDIKQYVHAKGQTVGKCSGTIADLSVGGMAFKTNALLEEGMCLYLRLNIPLEIRGEIRHMKGSASGGQHRYGVRFHRIGYTAPEASRPETFVAARFIRGARP